MTHRLPVHTGRISSNLRQYIRHAEIFSSTPRAPQLQRRRFTTTQRRQTLDHIPRFSHSVLLPNNIIAISGRDASTFLQGLLTTNVSSAALEQPNSQPGPDYTAKYAGLLNAQGRILHTFMVYPVTYDSPLAVYIPGMRSGEPYFLLDIPQAEMAAVQQRLKLYKLKSQVDIYHVHDFASLILWNDTQPGGHSTPRDASLAHLIAKDERGPDFGTRIIANHKSVDHILGASRVSFLDYARRRYQWGIPEGPTELVPKAALPHESNLDYMGAIDFRKGCYVGQELTIRTQHQGVIRKRIMPLKIEGRLSEGQNFQGLDLKVAEDGKRSVGKILATQGDVGIGLVRLAQAGFASEVADGEAQSDGAAGDGGVDLKVEGVDNVIVKPFVPSWWKERKSVH